MRGHRLLYIAAFLRQLMLLHFPAGPSAFLCYPSSISTQAVTFLSSAQKSSDATSGWEHIMFQRHRFAADAQMITQINRTAVSDNTSTHRMRTNRQATVAIAGSPSAAGGALRGRSKGGSGSSVLDQARGPVLQRPLQVEDSIHFLHQRIQECNACLPYTGQHHSPHAMQSCQSLSCVGSTVAT